MRKRKTNRSTNNTFSLVNLFITRGNAPNM